MVTNLIMGYLGCRILPLLGLPEFANKDYLDGIWDYFQSELFDEPMEGNSQMLSFLPALAFFDLTKLPDSMEGEFLGWQAISSLDADSLKHIYPFARHRILTNQKAEIEQSTRKVEVREEEIPLLLLYPLFFRFLLPAILGGLNSKNRPFFIHFSLCSIFYPSSCCKKCCNHSKGMIAVGFDDKLIP